MSQAFTAVGRHGEEDNGQEVVVGAGGVMRMRGRLCVSGKGGSCVEYVMGMYWVS